MERNGWETAIRCLEVALHPNTGDEEVIAAVNGYRRTAGGRSLAELARGAAPAPQRMRDEFDRLNRENIDLRRILLRRTDETEQRICELSEALLAACRRASAAEHRLAELNAAHAEIATELRSEIHGLRTALDQARHRVPEMRPAFRDILSSASSRSPWTA